MGSHELTWAHMDSHGLTWPHMISHDLTWPHMTSHDPLFIIGIQWYHDNQVPGSVHTILCKVPDIWGLLLQDVHVHAGLGGTAWARLPPSVSELCWWVMISTTSYWWVNVFVAVLCRGYFIAHFDRITTWRAVSLNFCQGRGSCVLCRLRWYFEHGNAIEIHNRISAKNCVTLFSVF